MTSFTSDGALETVRGWKITLPEPAVISRRCITMDELPITPVTLPRAGIRIEDLLLRDLETKPGDSLPADNTWECTQEGQIQRYACATSGEVGWLIDLWRLSDGSVWEVLSKVGGRVFKSHAIPMLTRFGFVATAPRAARIEQPIPVLLQR